MDEDIRKDLAYAVGNLRHAYGVLINDQLGNPKAFANGLIAPQITKLEALLQKIDDREVVKLPTEDELAEIVGRSLAWPSVYMEGVPAFLKPRARAMTGYLMDYLRTRFK